MEENEEDEDSSSSTLAPGYPSTLDTLFQDSNHELAQFRTDWRNELSKRLHDVQNSMHDQDQLSNELYQLAVLHEQRGLVTEAANLYRQAFKLFPEVEERYRRPHLQDQNAAADQKSSQTNSKFINKKSTEDDQINIMENDLQEMDVGNFEIRLPIDQNHRFLYCMPAKLGKSSTHIGSLPAELLMYIFKWVVSSHMDIRQLEQLSMVCRGFYVLCRDQELWKLAYCRLFHQNLPENGKSLVKSWRQMYLSTPHLIFTGVYISKISYIRHGEVNSFQDRGFYQQWHLVSYLRYLRFFDDGCVAMITSADEPSNVLPGLKLKQSLGMNACVGTYTMSVNGDHDVHVTAIVKRSSRKLWKETPTHRHSAERTETDQTFLMEFRIKASKKWGNYHLAWTDYLVKVKYGNDGHETTNRIDLSDKNFPPLYFSRVRSFSAACESILQ